MRPTQETRRAWAGLYGGAGLAMLIALGPGPAAGETATTSGESAPKLTLDRLYSLPWLTGTAPTGFAWSADGRYLAFLWDDEGRDFHDLWVVDVEDPELEPQRWTRMPRPEPEPPSSDDPVAAARERERVEADPGVTEVTWHPGGGHLVAVYNGDLWRVEKGTDPVRLTETEEAESAVAYSPRGDRLAFLRKWEIWSMAVDGEAEGAAAFAEPDRRTWVARGAEERVDNEIASFRWSPDGSRLALLEIERRNVPVRRIPDYLAEEPKLARVRRAYPGEEAARHRLGLLPSERVEEEEEVDWVPWEGGDRPDMLLSYHWSPDSTRLAVDSSDLYAKDRQLFVADVGGEAALTPPRRVARDDDPENETFYFWRVAWSTDSERLYFLSDRDEDYHVWAVAASGETPPERLTRGSWAVAEIYPVEGGLVVVGNRGRAEERHLFRVDDAGGEPIRLSERPGTHSPVVSPDGRHAAVAFSSDGTPPELLVTTLAGDRREQRVTESPVAEFASYRWVTPQYVSFPSHVDGTRLHGRLTLPPDFDPERTYPAILGSVYTDTVRNQWGGRTAHPTWGLDQYLAQEGYVLLNVDVRGSWGRGREHRRGIRLDYGGIDVEDLESGVRFLGELGYVDLDRVGIWGSSYGGLMTAMSLFRKPTLYAAGVAGAPATNVWHALTGQMAVMMRPEDQPEEYADSSPFLHAHGLTSPLMIIHGMRDRVVLYKDSVELVQRLILLGKEVDFVTLPAAGHGWDNEGLAQTRFAFEKLVGHFDRHLRAAP